jgi:hypothetical protein
MADATPYFLTLWPTLDLNGTLGASESVMGGSTMSIVSWREQAVLQYSIIISPWPKIGQIFLNDEILIISHFCYVKAHYSVSWMNITTSLQQYTKSRNLSVESGMLSTAW